MNLRRIDLNLLLVFDALMQEQNLSRAAERLNMSQPATSNALARLRETLDEPLFTRTARGMVPTTQAHALYEPVRQALHLLQIGLGPQGEFDLGTQQTFKLSMNDYGQFRVLPRLLGRVAELAPKVSISVFPDNADTLASRLANGELDLALDYLYVDDPDLRYQPLVSEELVVIGRAGHPAFAGGLTVASYQASQHISIHTRAGRGSPLEIVLGSAKVRRDVQAYVPNYLIIPAIVANSDLLGTIPRRLAEHALKTLALQMDTFPIETPEIRVSMIWHRHQDLSPGLRWLRDLIANELVD